MAVFVQDLLTEFVDNRVVRLASRQQHLVPQLIGFDQVASESSERVPHETFAARQPPCQPYSQHKCCSAAVTVFAISIAIVSGPTPPGTGVYAPASSSAASRSTSPTSPLPSAARFWPTSITVAPG